MKQWFTTLASPFKILGSRWLARVVENHITLVAWFNSLPSFLSQSQAPHHHRTTKDQIIYLLMVGYADLLWNLDHVCPKGIIIVQLPENVTVPTSLIETLFPCKNHPMHCTFCDLKKLMSSGWSISSSNINYLAHSRVYFKDTSMTMRMCASVKLSDQLVPSTFLIHGLGVGSRSNILRRRHLERSREFRFRVKPSLVWWDPMKDMAHRSKFIHPRIPTIKDAHISLHQNLAITNRHSPLSSAPLHESFAQSAFCHP